MANSPSLKELRPRDRMEFDRNAPLSQREHEVIALLIEGELTIGEICEQVGWSPQTVWRMRSKPAFQAEYRKQLALVETSAYDLAISRRVERIAALNETWLKLRNELAKRKIPRTDHVYALIALQNAAAKELGQDVQRVQVAITEPVQVIKFEAIPPRTDLEGQVLDAQFTEQRMPEPEPVEALAASTLDADLETVGVYRSAPRPLDPAQAEAIKRAIAEAGLDPRSVLVPEQFTALYGEEK